MAILDGIPVQCTLYMLRIGEFGKEGAEIDLDHNGASHFFNVLQQRDTPLEYEGDIVAGGQRFRGRAQVILLGYRPTESGARITIKATGAPEKI